MICDKIISDKNCNTVVLNEEFDSNYTYVYILQLNKHNGNTISQAFVREREDEEIVFTIGEDGFYTLCRLKIPKDGLYYYKDEKFYKDLLEVPLEELILVDSFMSGIEKEYYFYFLICKLRRCYINAALKVLNETTSIRCETKVDKFDIYKRDLLWSAINVINYLADMELFEEAERLLERILGCNGLCDDVNSCGCKCGQ